MNEELARRIQAGERELLPDLWEGVRGFVYKEAVRWCQAWQSRRPGLEVDDLAQRCFIEMCEMLEQYDPDKGAFITWLKYPLLTAFCVEVGCRTPAQLKRPENGAVSLNTPVGGEDEDLTLEGTLEDPGASLALDAVLDGVYQAQAAQIVGRAVDALSPRQQFVIRRRYYEQKSQREIAEEIGVSGAQIHQDESAALRQLRRDQSLWALRDYNPYKGTGLNAWRQTGSSAQERRLLRLEALEELRHRRR